MPVIFSVWLTFIDFSFLLARHGKTGVVSASWCNHTVCFAQHIWGSAVSRYAPWLWSLPLCQWCMLWRGMEVQCQKWKGMIFHLWHHFYGSFVTQMYADVGLDSEICIPVVKYIITLIGWMERLQPRTYFFNHKSSF